MCFTFTALHNKTALLKIHIILKEKVGLFIKMFTLTNKCWASCIKLQICILLWDKKQIEKSVIVGCVIH